MMHCPHCGWTTGSGADCERCAATLVRAGDDIAVPADNEIPGENSEWATIARFGNAAEAGYFAHELGPLLNCEPRIEYQEDFDAIGGSWRTRYLLAVPDRLAEQARRQLGTMLEGNWEQEQLQPTAGDAFYEIGSTATSRAPAFSKSRINWVPIMLTLAAGSAVFWAGRKAHFARRNVEPGEAGQKDLFEFLSEGVHPWVQRREDGDGQRELRIDPQSGTATIFEDTDGDGRFDRELKFPMRSH